MVPKSSRENKSRVESGGTENAFSLREQSEGIALRQSEAFLRSIYTGTGIAIYLVDVTEDGDFVYAGGNPAFERMSGRTSESIAGRRPEDLDPPQLPEAMARARANYRRCVETGEPLEYEQKALVAGQETWWLIRLEPLTGDNDAVVRIIGTAIPITERKQAEEAYHTLVNHSLQGLAIYQHGRILFANAALAEITGHAVAELLSMSPRQVARLTHPEDLPWISQKVQDIVAGKSLPPRERFRIVRKDGVVRWVETYGQHIVYNGQPAMQVASVDVTERVLAEAALREMEQYVLQVERLAAMGRMTAVLAHEIKNPLQAIKSNLELVLDHLDDSVEREEYLRLSLEELNRLVDMTGRILKTATPANEDFEIVSLADLVQRMLTLFNPTLQQTGIRLTSEIPSDLPPVRIVPNQISQVVLNIMNNAIEATPRAGYIKVVATLYHEHVRLDFTNSGSSIRLEHLDRIFDPFFTTKPEATGLGLSITHSILEQHGGALSAKNLSDEQGVTFTVTLPLSRGLAMEKRTV